MVTKFKFNVVQVKAHFSKVFCNDFGNFKGLFFQALVIFVAHNAENNKCVFGNQRVAFGIIFESGFNIAAFNSGAVSNVIAITADEAAGCFQTADNFQAFAEYGTGKNFHGSVFNVSTYIVRFNAFFFEDFKEMDGGFEVSFADTFNGQADAVFARVEYTVFAGAVIFKF